MLILSVYSTTLCDLFLNLIFRFSFIKPLVQLSSRYGATGFCYLYTEGACLFVFFCSWEQRVRILGLIPNDEKSMWLVGEEERKVQIGFIVSF